MDVRTMQQLSLDDNDNIAEQGRSASRRHRKVGFNELLIQAILCNHHSSIVWV